MGAETIPQPEARFPYLLAYVLSLFLATRGALLAIGAIAQARQLHEHFSTPGDFAKIWTIWDARWYMGIARDGYSAAPVNSENMANYAFFPLYPLLMRLVSYITGDYAVAGLVVSNACLIIACIYMYRFVRLDSDAETALRSVKYLILFPMAFLFSAVLTESLFVALAIMCLYYARRENWAAVGLFGFLIALTRSPGIFIVVPLAYYYLRQPGAQGPRQPRDGARRLVRPELLTLLLPPLGLALWSAYNYYLTGDFLGFVHIESTWGGHFVIPPVELASRLQPEDGYVFTGAVFTIAVLAIMLLFFRRVDFGAWMLGMMLIAFPLFTSQSSFSMIRYLAVVFPLVIIAAKVTRDRRIDTVLTLVLIVMQAILMYYWTAWSGLIV